MLFLPEYLSEMPKAVKWRQNLILTYIMKSKFNLLKIAGMAIALTFFACEKESSSKKENDDAGNDTSVATLTINATNVQSSVDDIALAAAFMPYETTGYELSRSDYKSNSFSFTLSASVEDKYLATNRIFMINKLSDNVFGNKKVKMNDVVLVAANKTGAIGHFYHTATIGEAEKEVTECYVYVKEDCTVKGGGNLNYPNGTSVSFSIDCSLKKGYNIAYEIENNTDKSLVYTSTKPSGLTWKWVFAKYMEVFKSNHSFQILTVK